VPILTNHRDSTADALRRATQEDPWVMYLVVQQEAAVRAEDLLIAATQATMRCVDTLQHEPRWAGSFAAWSERSFRKVTLRAKGAAWARIEGYEGGTGEVDGVAVVRALPPRLRSEGDALLRKLQVYNPAADTLLPAGPVVTAGEPAMVFVRNPAATMSVGKQVAQVAHAVLMCAWSAWAEDPRYQASFAAWRAAGYPGRVGPSADWARLRDAADGVVVRDGGLTEVEPGTETVLALPPGHPL
jgi:peptidyl-tRNA hydrolase